MTKDGSKIVYIALGSNIGNPETMLNSAVNSLKTLKNSAFIATSSFFWNPALLLADDTTPQPDYLNGVCKIQTPLSADNLLQELKSIEAKHGRVKHKRWDSRTLDLDLLLYGDSCIISDRLKVPHPEIKNRLFVLYPLAQIAPDLIFPDGVSIQDALTDCPKTKLTAL